MSDELPHGLGRRHAPDERDKRFLMRETVFPHVLPKPRKRPYNLGPTLDQGASSQCVGYSSRDKLASAPLMVRGETGPTPFEIYKGAQARDEWPGEDYEGTSVRGAFKYLQENQYLGSYVWANSLTDCEKFIRDGYGTIIVGTDWLSDMAAVQSDGFLKVDGYNVGGHAYHLFWMDPEKQEAWCKNSWGEAWGIRLHGRLGCFKLHYADLDRLLALDGEAGAGIELKVKP